jgi:putative acetyltransferase
MARIQSAALREHARAKYTDEPLAHLAPPDPDATDIPEKEFEDTSCHPIVAEQAGTIVGWGSVHLEEDVLAAMSSIQITHGTVLTGRSSPSLRGLPEPRD